MKRKAILIGNTSGLNGVKIDLNNLSSFLKSNKGGAWKDNEIELIVDEKKHVLLEKIDSFKRQSFDYATVIFSGHGGQERETVLELNASGEKIEETLLRKIAPRQLNIYDCCRAYSSTLAKSLGLESASFSEAVLDSVDMIRQRYNDRIMQSIEQQALLFSCKIGQVSYDTPAGGVYALNLLKSAMRLRDDEKFKLVGIAHQEAVEPTLENSKNEPRVQQPESILPKCLSEQQLIISINDKKQTTWL